jgi:hypothetical protein
MEFRFTIAVTLMLLLPLVMKAQQDIPSPPQLSEEHEQKLEKITDSSKKLRKYKKFFKQDSISWAKKHKKTLKHAADTLIKEQTWQAVDEKKQELNNLVPEKMINRYIPFDTAAIGNLKEAPDSIWLEKLGKTLADSLAPEELEKYQRVFNKGKRPDTAAIINKAAGEYRQEVSTLMDADSSTVNDAIGKYKREFFDEIADKIPFDTTTLGNLKETTDSVWLEKAGKLLMDSVKGVDAYQPVIEEAKQLKDSASFDYISKKAEKHIEDQARDLEDVSAFQEAQKEFEGAEELSSISKQADLEARKAAVKKQMVSVANEQLRVNIGKVEAAQAQLTKLKKKYSKVVNSNDLSTAVKRSSLEGKTFWQRLVIGGNFQVQNFKPLTLDASPALGYRINKLFNAGVGGYWRHTFGDTVSLAIPFSSVGYKAFISHQLYRNFFGYSEYERQQVERLNPLTDDQKPNWQDAWHIGLGRNIKVNKIVTVQVLVIYNLLHDPFNPLYSSPWNVKAGIQMNTESIKGLGKSKKNP